MNKKNGEDASARYQAPRGETEDLFDVALNVKIDKTIESALLKYMKKNKIRNKSAAVRELLSGALGIRVS